MSSSASYFKALLSVSSIIALAVLGGLIVRIRREIRENRPQATEDSLRPTLWEVRIATRPRQLLECEPIPLAFQYVAQPIPPIMKPPSRRLSFRTSATDLLRKPRAPDLAEAQIAFIVYMPSELKDSAEPWVPTQVHEFVLGTCKRPCPRLAYQ